MELAGSNKAFGVDALVDAEKGGLAPLLQEFTGPFGEPDAEARKVEALERELDAWANRAALLPFAARVDEVAAGEDGACWDFVVGVEEPLPGLPPELGMRCWPVTLAEHRGQATRLEQGVVATFDAGATWRTIPVPMQPRHVIDVGDNLAIGGIDGSDELWFELHRDGSVAKLAERPSGANALRITSLSPSRRMPSPAVRPGTPPPPR